jgi:alpha-L-rhamnosidase
MQLKPRAIHLLLSALSIFPLLTFAAPSCKVVNMKCEYLVDPIGVDVARPRLCWQLSDTRQGAGQTAYQIYVGTDSAEVANGNGNMWASLKTESEIQLVKYEGKELQPFTRYYWRVVVWDKNQQQAYAPLAKFETGMKDLSNWKGSWIADNQDVDLKPAPYFRKTFTAHKKIKSARA